MLTVTIAGRIGRDAELRTTPNGKAVCNFSVAVDRRAGGEKQTVWTDCAIWEKRAEALAPYLKKGSAVVASGELTVRQYEKRNGGGTGIAIECNVREITLLGGGERQADGGHDWKGAEAEARASAPAAAPAAPTGDAPFNDDIPFAPLDYRRSA